MAVNYRPAERRTLENLLGAMQSGLDPGLGLSMFQDTQQGALDRLLQQRAMRTERQGMNQAALSGVGDQLTQAALGGVPPEGLASLLGLQATANPALQRPQMASQLGDLLGFAGGLAGSVPTAASPGLTPEDIAAIEGDLENWATGSVKQASGLPMGLHEATMAIVGQLRLQGFPESELERVRQFIEQRWAEFGGPPRPIPSQPAAPAVTPAASSSGGGLGMTAGQGYARAFGPDLSEMIQGRRPSWG
jgi:hypothetical protein